MRHALITGGSSGIGLALAKRLASHGIHLSLIARRQDQLQQAADGILRTVKNKNLQCKTYSADVSDLDSITQAVDSSCKDLGVPDLLVTSAGIAAPDYFLQLPIENYQKTMAVNFFGTLYPIKILGPRMMARKSGHIQIVSSGAGLIGLFGYTSYAPSKFALRGLAESLRGELKPHGVHVSIVYPPDTDTPQLAQENLTKPAEAKRITGTAKVMKAEDVAAAMEKGIAKKQFAIAPGFEMKSLLYGHSLIGCGLQKYFDYLTK